MKRHPPTTVWGALKEAVVGDPLAKQYERVEAAVKAKAKCVSDAEFNRTMAGFYTERVLSIDPHAGPEQAWEFADAKQKQYDHQIACVGNDHDVEEAAKVVEAETARYLQLQH